MKIQEWGLIEKYWEQDWLLWGEYNFLKYKNPYRNLNEYNQLSDTIHRNSCTIFGSMASVGYNCWIDFTQDEVEKASQRAIDDWVVDPNAWATFVWATDFVRKYCNRLYSMDLISYRVPINWEQFKEWLDNGWSFTIWYRTSRDLLDDTEKDWVAWEGDYPKGGGHLVYYVSKENNDYVVNSYVWLRKYNQFRFDKFSDLVKNAVMFSFAYVLIRKNINMNILPTHNRVSDTTNNSHKDIILEWERILQKAITEKNYTPLYNNYTDDEYITKMLIEIAYIRKDYWKDF